MKDKTKPVCIISVTHTSILGIKGKSRDNMCVLCSFKLFLGKDVSMYGLKRWFHALVGYIHVYKSVC